MLDGLGAAPPQPVVRMHLGDSFQLRIQERVPAPDPGPRLSAAQQRRSMAADILQQGIASLVTSGAVAKLSQFGQMGGELLFDRLWGEDPTVVNREELRRLYGVIGSVAVTALVAPSLGIVHRFVEGTLIQARRRLGSPEVEGVLPPGRFSGVDYTGGHAYRNAREDQAQIQKLVAGCVGAAKGALFPSLRGTSAANAGRRYAIDISGSFISGMVSQSIILLRNPEHRPRVYRRVSVPNPDRLAQPNRLRPHDGESVTRLFAALASSTVPALMDLAAGLQGYSTRAGPPTAEEAAMRTAASAIFGGFKGYFLTAIFLEQRARMDGDRPRARQRHASPEPIVQRRMSY